MLCSQKDGGPKTELYHLLYLDFAQGVHLSKPVSSSVKGRVSDHIRLSQVLNETEGNMILDPLSFLSERSRGTWKILKIPAIYKVLWSSASFFGSKTLKDEPKLKRILLEKLMLPLPCFFFTLEYEKGGYAWKGFNLQKRKSAVGKSLQLVIHFILKALGLLIQSHHRKTS